MRRAFIELLFPDLLLTWQYYDKILWFKQIIKKAEKEALPEIFVG